MTVKCSQQRLSSLNGNISKIMAGLKSTQLFFNTLFLNRKYTFDNVTFYSD